MARYGSERFTELVYHRYGSGAELYLSNAMRRGRLDAAVDTILKKSERDDYWQLYCAYVANAFTESISYDDFLKRSGVQQKAPKKSKQIKRGMSSTEVKKQTLKAEKLLKSFKKPDRKGGVR